MLPRFLRLAVWSPLLGLLGLTGCSSYRPDALVGTSGPGVRIVESNQVLRVELNGQLFTQYHYQNVSRPFLYPLLGAGGEHLTRRWPQETVPGEEHDHPHHHALWYAHGDVNGVDLWSESDKAGRTVHQTFLKQESGRDRGVIVERNEWRSREGKALAHEERTLEFHRPAGTERIIDFTFKIQATQGELVLGDTKEGTFAIRVAESMRVMQPKNQPGAGHLVNSRGDRDGAVWGKRAEWADYYGPVDGKTVGVAIFDHPANPRYPTWWHARDYGLFAANPFGQHDFEKRAKGAGDLKIPEGGSVTFRYRVVLHPGDTQEAGIAARHAEYVQQTIRKP
jgi:hypothetical protein